MLNFSRRFLSLVTVIIVPLANAHHSVTYHFDPQSPGEIEGVVKEFRFKNPHSEIFIDVVDENGQIVTWRAETTSRATTEKQGWTEKQFVPGQKVKISGFFARREEHSIYLREAEFVDGSTTSFNYGRLAKPEEQTAEIDTRPLGNWVRTVAPTDPTRDGQPPNPGDESPFIANLSDAGRKAADGYDATKDDPALRCELPSIVRVWTQPDYSPTNISQEGDVVTIQHEVFDVVRKVYLDQATPPESVEPNVLGHSIGWYEDGDLYVETTGFRPGVLITHPGILHTDELKILEKLSVNEATGVLRIEWTAIDPINFANPQHGGAYLTRSDIAISKFGCGQ